MEHIFSLDSGRRQTGMLPYPQSRPTANKMWKRLPHVRCLSSRGENDEFAELRGVLVEVFIFLKLALYSYSDGQNCDPKEYLPTFVSDGMQTFVSDIPPFYFPEDSYHVRWVSGHHVRWVSGPLTRPFIKGNRIRLHALGIHCHQLSTSGDP